LKKSKALGLSNLLKGVAMDGSSPNSMVGWWLVAIWQTCLSRKLQRYALVFVWENVGAIG
jgi:hypothetical protein